MARAARHLEEAGISEGAVRRGAAVAEHRRHRGEARAVLGGGGRRVAQRGEAALQQLAEGALHEAGGRQARGRAAEQRAKDESARVAKAEAAFKAEQAAEAAAKKEAAEAAMRASAAGQGKDMATFMEGAWHISVIDVESTLRTVCKKVLSDTSVPKEARLKRAAAMRRCGEIFLAAESPESVGADGKKKTLREQMEAFLGPMMGGMDGEMGAWAEGDEGDDDDDDDLPPSTKAKVYSREALLLFSVKELRALMRERGLVAEGCLEKADFVDAVLAQQAGMAGATDGSTAASSSAAAPPASAPAAPKPAEDPLKFELEDSDGEK